MVVGPSATTPARRRHQVRDRVVPRPAPRAPRRPQIAAHVPLPELGRRRAQQPGRFPYLDQLTLHGDTPENMRVDWSRFVRQSRPPPQDQSTAMNAATPSIQDFVDRTHLVERRLRTGDTMRCLDCGQALPTPTGGYRAAIRCGCRVWLPSRAPLRIQRPPTVRRHAGAARHDHRLVQLGGYRRRLDHVGRCPMRSGAQRRRVPRLPTPPHAAGTTEDGDGPRGGGG